MQSKITKFTIDNPVKTLEVRASSRGKVPSIYVNKTFALTYTGSAQTEHPEFGIGGWDSYESTMKNGKRVTFTKFVSKKEGSPQWFVQRPEHFRGTWLYDVTETY